MSEKTVSSLEIDLRFRGLRAQVRALGTVAILCTFSALLVGVGLLYALSEGLM